MTIPHKNLLSYIFKGLIGVLLALTGGCASAPQLPPSTPTNTIEPAPMYIIGPGDNINVFVWGNGDLSTSVPVRPDGRITTPLVEDVQASGKTPTQLAREMEQYLARYVKNPVVTVNVTGFVGRFSEQVRVIGEASKPSAIPFRQNMTLLDVMIEVGGLTEFANGDGSTIVRTTEDGTRQQFVVRIDSLISDGDITANVNMMPGDILIIPESWF
ncbi:MAG: XrtA/PEP-CTERM system exopolysaccharide export protein [Thiohalomonadales bacterium]